LCDRAVDEYIDMTGSQRKQRDDPIFRVDDWIFCSYVGLKTSPLTVVFFLATRTDTLW
jgi:hypothetical protein